MDYKLIKENGCYYVANLPSDYNPEPDNKQLLLVVYPEGDCDTVSEPDDKMHQALYDLYQTNPNLKEGDRFTFDGIAIFQCLSVHVVHCFDDMAK